MLRIGPVTLETPLLLAPIAGPRDLAFRILCREQGGVGLASTDLLNCRALLRESPKSLEIAATNEHDRPCGMQLYGNWEDPLPEAARWAIDHGAELIDINMGCPAKKVCNKLCGSALLQDEPLVARILETVVTAVAATGSGVPVTLKTRTGWDREHRNGVRVAQIAEQSGIAALAIHGRTRADFYEGEAEYDTIRAIRATVRIPVLANGDIDGADKARHVLSYTGASGVMVGRASHGAPWIFRDINGLLARGVVPPALSAAERRDIVLAHLQAIYAFHGEESGLRIARKHLGWYARLLDRTPDARALLMAASSTSTQYACAAELFGAWAAVQ